MADGEQVRERERTERQARADELRRDVQAMPEPASALVCEAISEAVGESLVDGAFGEHLARKGWALVYVGDGQCPEPPPEFLEGALDVMEPGWIDPLGRAAELWREAWTAGHRVGLASPHEREEGESRG